MKQKLFILLLAIASTMNLWGERYEIGGIAYWVTSDNPREVEVCGTEDANVTTLNIPSTVQINSETYTVIGVSSWGLDDLKSLKTVNLPNTVRYIGRGAFSGDNELQTVNIPSSVTSIGEHSFYQCTKLQSITIPSTMTSIGNATFYECSSLSSITIPDNVTSIGGSAFYRCSSLPTVTIPAKVTSIGSMAFSGCSGLTSVNFATGSELTTIGLSAFSSCSSLTSIDIPATVTAIEQTAFENCTLLATITMPSGSQLTTVGGGCFANTAWEGNQPDNSLIYISNVLYKCKGSVPNVTVKAGTESILTAAFKDNTNLQTISIPASLTTIGESVFWGCTNLNSVTFASGSNLNFIGSKTFAYCTSLSSITIPGNPYISNDIFVNNPTTVATLSLTANQVGEDYWMTFYNKNYHFKAADNTTVYKATLNGQSLTLTKVEDNIVTENTAVILKSTTPTPEMTLWASASSDEQSNDLVGVTYNHITPVPDNCYTLANGSSGVGFYQYSGTELNVGKAYVIYVPSSPSRNFIGFDETGVTAIKSPAAEQQDGTLYDLMGRKVQKPVHGIYMKNGHKIVVK